MNKIGFDTKRYLVAQEKAIRERLAKFSGRLYLEFGGKLMADFHAARSLPGYDPDAKVRLLKALHQDLEVLYCVSAKQLANGKIRGDWGMGYDLATIKALEDLEAVGLTVAGVVINRFEGENEAKILEKRLKRMGIKVFKRYEIDGYPRDLENISSAQGYGRDEDLKTKKPLVVVWGAGPGSGKLSTCLGQIYLDAKKGLNSGYAKFETFPVWDLPLDHPVNLAYEAATADLGDFNLIDPFHLQAYQKIAVNYNRDVEAFPIIKAIFEKILSEKNFSRSYCSPTDMGFNVLSRGIIDEKIICEAAKKEIVFYLFRYRQEYKKGLVDQKTLERVEMIMKRLGTGEEYLKTVPAARQAKKEATQKRGKGERGIYCGAAIELPDGRIISGKNSPLLHAEAAVVLNAIKVLGEIPDNLDLISPAIIKQINKLKKQIKEKSTSLNCTEALLALAISSQVNPVAQKAQGFLNNLRGCFMHTTHELSAAEQSIFSKLGIWVSTDGQTAKVKSE